MEAALNIVALQMDIAWEQKAANFQKTRDLLAQAAPPKGSLVILPEMFGTGFTMNTDACAELYGGETELFLGNLAREFGVCVLAGAAMRNSRGQTRNKALAFGPEGTLLGFYSKMKLFSPGGEHAHYKPGTQPMVFEWRGWRICPFVCYDLRFPEIFRHAVSTHQPELFVVIANWPSKRAAHWLRLLPARAVENQAYVAGVNRVGADPFYTYSGRSMVIDPQGDVLADAGEAEGAIQAEIDLHAMRQYRQGLPFLKDLDWPFLPGDSACHPKQAP